MKSQKSRKRVVRYFIGVIVIIVTISLASFTVAQEPSPAGGNWLKLDGMDDYADCMNCTLPDVESMTTEGFTTEAWINIRDFPAAVPGTVSEAVIIDAGGCQLSLYTMQLDNPTEWIKGVMFKVPSTKSEAAKSIAFTGWVDPRTYGEPHLAVVSKMGKQRFVAAFGGILDWTVPNANEWIHVAGVIDQTEDVSFHPFYQRVLLSRVSIFLNGKTAMSTLFSKDDMAELKPGVMIGDDLGILRRHFSGYVDEIFISNTARYDADKSYDVPAAPFEPDTKTHALWHFDEPAGSTSFADASGGNNVLNAQRGAITQGVAWQLEGRSVSYDSLCDLNKPELSPRAITVAAGTEITITACGNLDEELQQPLALIVRIHNPSNSPRATILPFPSDVIVHHGPLPEAAFALYYPWAELAGWAKAGSGKLEVEVKPNDAVEFLYLIPRFSGEARIELVGIGSFTIAYANKPPIVLGIPDRTIKKGDTFIGVALDDYVSDPDNEDAEIVWTYSENVELAVGISDARVAIITVPDPEWSGSETINFTATDPGGLSASDNATFTVTPVNDPPVVSDIPDQTIDEGGTFTSVSLDDYVSDPDNADAEMTWTYSGNTELAVGVSDDRIATIAVPDPGWTGSETITFTATDLDGLSAGDSAEFTVEAIVLLGDVNDDGAVRSNDAILALRIAAGLMEPTEYQKQAADMNGDGEIKANDAILVLRKAAGLNASRDD